MILSFSLQGVLQNSWPDQKRVDQKLFQISNFISDFHTPHSLFLMFFNNPKPLKLENYSLHCLLVLSRNFPRFLKKKTKKNNHFLLIERREFKSFSNKAVFTKIEINNEFFKILLISLNKFIPVSFSFVKVHLKYFIGRDVVFVLLFSKSSNIFLAMSFQIHKQIAGNNSRAMTTQSFLAINATSKDVLNKSIFENPEILNLIMGVFYSVSIILNITCFVHRVSKTKSSSFYSTKYCRHLAENYLGILSIFHCRQTVNISRSRERERERGRDLAPHSLVSWVRRQLHFLKLKSIEDLNWLVEMKTRFLYSFLDV